VTRSERWLAVAMFLVELLNLVANLITAFHIAL
jgi:hypothetical protein